MIVPGEVDPARLRAVVLAELKKAGLKHRAKKPNFKNVKDMKSVFGAPLSAVVMCTVNCCGSNLSVPAVVLDLCAELRQNVGIEGIFRKAGSAIRQKEIRRLLDCGGSVSAAAAHPVDLASLLKLYLRTLPEPLIGREVQELLLRCRLSPETKLDSEDHLTHILHTLMLLPVMHLHLLHYIMELLHFVSSHSKLNLMDANNLAIVMAPSIMPLPAVGNSSSAQRLQHHVALVKMMIENAQMVGSLSPALLSQLEGDEGGLELRRKKRRSGSLNRVLNGLRKMVGGGERVPATPARDPPADARTPIICKSAAKRKHDTEGLSSKTRKEIKRSLAQKEISFTPRKMCTTTTERKKIRLSMMEAALPSEEMYESSSEELHTSPDHPFTTLDTIDLSDSKPDKDYVKIPKREFEEIKNRVSAIESRLSKDWTDLPVHPLQQVQNVYEKTLEDAASLDLSSSDSLARRFSRELNIRPSQGKIVRSPSARKIGTIRRRSKENVTKIIRHKSWNVSTQSRSGDVDRFYPYVGLKRGRPNTLVSGLPDRKAVWKSAVAVNGSTDTSEDTRQSHVLRRQSARESTAKNTLDSEVQRRNASDESELSPTKHKWRSAAAYFMERTGECDKLAQTGRPSVNKLRSQNAGAVLEKAKMFESSSDRSSEFLNTKITSASFARKQRANGSHVLKASKSVPPPVLKVKPNSARIVEDFDSDKVVYYANADPKRGKNAQASSVTAPDIKKPLCSRSPRSFRSHGAPPAPRSPLRPSHPTSPRRRSPRLAQRSRN